MNNRIRTSLWALNAWAQYWKHWMSSSAHKWNGQTFWFHQLDFVLWTMVLWVRELDVHLPSLKHQARLLLWAINLWARKVEAQTMAAGEIPKQAINVWFKADLWLERCNALLMVVLATIVITAVINAVLSWVAINHNKKPRKYQRKTSLASLTALDREFLEETASMKQNVINTILTFDQAPTRGDWISIMKTLANKYERMGSVPRFVENQECVWDPIGDLDWAVEKCVTLDADYNESYVPGGNGMVHALQKAQVHVGTILPTEEAEGNKLPLWRAVILSPTVVLVRIDHGICDGLSAVTLLKAVGIKTSSKEPLALRDMSPILRAAAKAGDLRISLLPLKLLWLPNLVRAVRFLSSCLSLGKEQPNPLRPLPQHLKSHVPSGHYGTVYMPTMPVALFKDIATGMGDGTTVNDILLLCMSIAFGRYIDALTAQGHHEYSDTDKVKVLLPIGNPLKPSEYGDYYNGLCNRMTPVIVPLNVPRQNGNVAAPYTPTDYLGAIKDYMQQVKGSNTPLFMTLMNTILAPLMSLDIMKEAAKNSFDSISCVYSNVPGPTESISLQPTTSHRSFKINTIQTVLPHPVSIFQVLSYNHSLFFNITLDTRAGSQPWILRSTFVDAVTSVANASGAASKWAEELKEYNTSTEWGGTGIVYECGGQVKKAKDLKQQIPKRTGPKKPPIKSSGSAKAA